jgi:hypothetical protein
MDRRASFIPLSLALMLFYTAIFAVIPQIPSVKADPPLTIDMTYSASERNDVKGIAFMGVHVVFTDTKSAAMGAKIFFEGEPGQWYTNEKGWCIIPVVSWEIGRYNLTIESIYFGDEEKGFQMSVPEASTLFDKVLIDLMTPETRIGVGTEAPITWDATYASDGAQFQGDLVFNHENFTSNEIGLREYTVEGIIDDQYGVTVYEADSVDIVYDRVNVTIVADEDRVDTGSETELNWVAYHEYDGAQFQGWVEFNDSLTQEDPGVYSYSVSSIFDIKYDVDSFVSNIVEVVFDEVVVTLGAERDRVDVGERAQISWEAHYWYNSEPFRGDITLNRGSYTSHKVGQKNYYVERIEDPLYGLTSFSTNEIEVTWDRLMVELMVADDRINVGERAEISWEVAYESNGTEVTEAVTIVLSQNNFVKEGVGERLYRVLDVTDHLNGIESFMSEPLNVIWDRVDVDLDWPGGRVGVNERAPLAVVATYGYDGVPLQGEVVLNDSLVNDEIGARGITVSSVSDTRHGLTVFTSNEVSILWDEVVVEKYVGSLIPFKTTVTLDVYYASDSKPVVDADILMGGKTFQEVEPGRYVLSMMGLQPYTRVNIDLSGPGFSQQYKYGNLINLGTLGVLATLIAAVAAFLVYRSSLNLPWISG